MKAEDHSETMDLTPLATAGKQHVLRLGDEAIVLGAILAAFALIGCAIGIAVGWYLWG